MRTARPVGLSEDGRSLVVETGDGERIAIPADAQLRRALRGDRPRRLEVEVESRLTPREIQMQVRAGASAEEIAETTGMPIERVEAFAAPVIAERNHIAGLAQQGSARRRGEPTGHRTLRLAVAERLRERGVDPDTARWDAFKMDDGRWSVSVAYRLEQADRVAVFYFDHRGRFSVAGNDEARWVIGEQAEPVPGAVDDDLVGVEGDWEPTLKLAGPAEELALLRALETGVEDESPDGEDDDAAAGNDQLAGSADEPGVAGAPAQSPELEATEVEATLVTEITEITVDVEETADGAGGSSGSTGQESASSEPIPDEPSQLDVLYDLLGGEGYAEESTRVYKGLTDAAAVPDVADGDWQPSADEDFPAEPEPASDPGSTSSTSPAGSVPPELPPVPAPQPGTEPQPETGVEPQADTRPQADAQPQPETGVEPAPEPQAGLVAGPDPRPRPEAESARQADHGPEAEPETGPQTAAETGSPSRIEPGPETGADRSAVEPVDESRPDRQVLADGATQEALPGAEQTTGPGSEPGQGTPLAQPPAKPKKRKRAAVPSWDEIMFGSPKNK